MNDEWSASLSKEYFFLSNGKEIAEFELRPGDMENLANLFGAICDDIVKEIDSLPAEGQDE